MDETKLTFGEAFARSEREKDARAAEAIGWRWSTVFELWFDKHGRSEIRPPAFGSDPAAARLLVEALKEEERGAFELALCKRLGLDFRVEVDHNGKPSGFALRNAALFALLLAPPAAIRDAVLEVMGE